MAPSNESLTPTPHNSAAWRPMVKGSPVLDRQFVRTHTAQVKHGVVAKGYNPTIVDDYLLVDVKLRDVETRLSKLRHERKEAASLRDFEAGKRLKDQMRGLEDEFRLCEREARDLLMQIPNLAFDDVPVGDGESANRVLRQWGERPPFDFEPKDHMTLARELDLYDLDAGAKVAGSKFYFTKNQAVMLEFGLLTFVAQKLAQRGYVLTITPDVARSELYLGTGYLPKGDEAQTYVIEGDDLGLIATAEVTLAGQFADEILDERQLPAKFLGYSHAFRREQGAYGRYSHGLYRVHQFTKAELFVFCTPEDAHSVHLELLAIQEEIYQELEIPYRVVEAGTGDLGAMAARKFDIEAWMPGRNDYGEITSTSNCTDYQARNLNIRFRRKSGEIEYAHMLNGTAIAMSRVPIAILENFQRADGSIYMPEALRPFVGFDEIRK